MSAPAALELALYHITVSQYWKVASMTILLYDYLITFEREVELIWKSSWGIGKALFLFVRYTTFIDLSFTMWLYFAPNISVEDCIRINSAAILVVTFSLASSEAILFLRTSALYANRPKVSFCLILIWMSVLFTSIVIISLYLHSVRFGPPPPLFSAGCYQTAGSKIVYGAYVALLLQETIIVIFTMHRAVQTGIRTKNRLAQTLYRDGLLYYLYLIGISVANIVLLAVGPPSLNIMIVPFLRVLHTILSVRVLLNARAVASHKEVTVTDLGSVFTTFIEGTIHSPDVDGEEPVDKVELTH